MRKDRSQKPIQRGSIRPAPRPTSFDLRPQDPAATPGRRPGASYTAPMVNSSGGGARPAPVAPITPVTPARSATPMVPVAQAKPVTLAPTPVPTSPVLPVAPTPPPATTRPPVVVPPAPVSAPMMSTPRLARKPVVINPIPATTPAIKLPDPIPEPFVRPADTTAAEALEGKKAKARRVEKETKAKARKSRKTINAVKKYGLIALAIILFGVTAYVAVDTWRTNNSIKAELTSSGDEAPQTEADKRQAQEGTDETKQTVDIIGNYRVADDAPRVLSIESLGLEARILPMGVNSDGTIQAPINIYDSGWYTDSATPGQDGAAFIDAHASGRTREGLFAYIDTLKKNDIVKVEMGNGNEVKYKVVHVETVPLDGIDMRKALLPYGDSAQGLNLMTCTGNWVNSGKTYDQRVIVYTVPV